MNRQDGAEKEVLAGLVERVTYHNAENGFCVLRIKARGHRDLITVIGQQVNGLPLLATGIMIALTACNFARPFLKLLRRLRLKALRCTLGQV